MSLKNSFLNLFCVLLTCIQCTNSTEEHNDIHYPETNKSGYKDVYFDAIIEDPYQWLEDDNSTETKEWVNAQNGITYNYLSQIPYREKIRQRFTELYDYAKISKPIKAGNNYFFCKKEGLQNQDVIYIQKGLNATPEVFLDPNMENKEGTIAYSISSFSQHNKYATITVSESGSDWKTLRVMDIEKNNWLSDTIEWVKFGSVKWYKDGFFYSRFPEPDENEKFSKLNTNMKVFYHQLGSPQSKDALVYKDDKNPYIFNYIDITNDNRYLLLYRSTGTDGRSIYYKDLTIANWEFKPLIEDNEHNPSVIGNVNGRLYILTDQDAPNYKLIAIDPKHPQQENWLTILPESENILKDVSLIGGKLFANYMVKAASKVKEFNVDGTFEKDIELQGIGTVKGFNGDFTDNEIFYTYSSFTDPGSIYLYDVNSGQSKLFYQTKVKFDASQYESKQVVFKSKDSTEVSMFLVYKKGLKLDGNNPCYLYGYGGFNVSKTPTFNPSNIILLENGGIYALANIRGGGEYGQEWHEAGMLMKKQNVFDDFIAAGEYLIKENYTSYEKLAIAGGSNGGLLVGAVMTQHPGLAKVAFPAVGLFDMLKYHKFTLGRGWVPEYGSSEQSEEMFNYLLGYSPYHNLKKGVEYPATMITTADHDDRVVPGHSFKFAARLQEMHEGDNPVLIRVTTSAGHGAGKPTSKIIEEQTDKWSFMFYNIGMKEVVYP
ncbi:MAG: prolyl oligopeptidase family serine peptidase [Chitinophagales bacterium]